MHFLDSNKRAFTLLELLLSIAILAVLFSYLYMNFFVAKQSTEATKVFKESVLLREQISKLLYEDIINSTKIVPTSGSKYDKVDMESKNSLHNILTPNIRYTVIDDGRINVLVRLESSKALPGITGTKDFYIDEIVRDVEDFKMINYATFVEYFLKIKNQKPIHFKLFLGNR